jgi:putative PIG3 family NAD(P)H quinone oxidoreductase
MRAVVLREFGGPEVLQFEEVADPVPGPEEILVDVAATALNRADLLHRRGLYPDPTGPAVDIPGMEFSGIVAAVGTRARRWHIGDEVMGIVAGGAYAERLVVHERQAMPVPTTVPLVDAAAIPEVFLTAWDALVLQGKLTSGRWALVHAGASGVGTAAIQIAKAIGARIAVTCSAPKADACRGLGADAVFERSPHDWAADAAAAVPGGFDTILDVIGGDELLRNLGVLASQGTLVQVGTMGGGATVNSAAVLGALMGKRATLVGTTLRPRPLEQKIAVTQRFTAEMLPLFESGELQPVIDRHLPFPQIASGHELMEANANTGKLVITLQA